MTVEAKRRLRVLMRQVRAKAHAANPRIDVRDALLRCLDGVDPVAGYWPILTEADPRPAMGALAGKGCAVCLPVVVSRNTALTFRQWVPGAAMTKGAHDIEIPADGAAIRPAALIVPLLAFDREGWRLGYGGGFYDRTLAALRPGGVLAVGLAYAAQEVPAVPHDVDDQPLDLVVTENEIIETGTTLPCD
jgi:5-formyltetrahydrofolate cyclo-ligase